MRSDWLEKLLEEATRSKSKMPIEAVKNVKRFLRAIDDGYVTILHNATNNFTTIAFSYEFHTVCVDITDDDKEIKISRYDRTQKYRTDM